MIARICRLSTALFISAAAWLHQPVAIISCGPYYDGEDVHITCFDPAVLPDSLFGTYFRLAVGGASHMSSEEEFNWPADTPSFDRNIHDWSAYLGDAVPLADIAAFVYRDSVGQLEMLMTAMRDGAPLPVWPDSGGAITARTILERADTAMLRYLIFAKDMEYLGGGGYWEYQESTPDSAEIASLLERGLAELAGCRDDRLRLRYGYQLVRLANYATDEELALRLYDSIVAPNPATADVRYMAMLHRTGALLRLGRTDEANYALSRIFENSPDRRWIALHDFGFDSSSTWENTYALARNSRERSTLWMMRGLREYTLDTRPMEEMVKLAPSDPRLDVMLLREVREVERRLFSERVTRPIRRAKKSAGRGTSIVDLDGWTWASDWTDTTDDPRYPARLARFAEQQAERGRIASRALWYAVAGYMRIIGGDFATAERDLDRAGQTLTESGKLEKQIEVLRLLARARSNRPLSTNVASQYTHALEWVDTARRGGYDPLPYIPAAMLLGQKFLRQGDVPRAAGAFVRGRNWIAAAALLDFYATDADLLQLQRLLERPRRRTIDTFLFDRFPLGAPQILDLRATRMMRKGRFTAAVALWDELYSRRRDTTSSSDTLSPEMIEARGIFTATLDTTLPDETGPAFTPVEKEITRSAFARQMVAYERLAAQGRQNRVRYSHAIAQALRSTPYWGYSRELWDGSLLYAFRYFARPTQYPFNLPGISRRMVNAQVTFLREYGSNEIAWRYLDRARRAATSRELAAELAFEMDEALKNPQTSLHVNEERQNRTGYRLLRTRYSGTTFAQKVMTSCGTYEYFEEEREKRKGKQ